MKHVYFDDVGDDPVSFLFEISSVAGDALDVCAARLDVQRMAGETDAELRTRTVKATCSCRGQVHVLGLDKSTWHHCQCGANAMLR